MENDRSKFSNLNNWKEVAWKKKQDFNGIRTRDLRDTGAMLYQLSYEATRASGIIWSIYEIIHNWTAVVEESGKWIIAVNFFNLNNWKEEAFF